jgi:hypothetical protein
MTNTNEMDATNRTQQLASMWALQAEAHAKVVEATATFVACDDDASYDAAFAAMDRAIARSEYIRKCAVALAEQIG